MAFTFDETNKQVKSVKVPKFNGGDAQLIESAEVAKAFLDNIMKTKLNIIK